MEKAISCYKADGLIASLPSFHSVQLSLAVRKFRAAGKECCKRGHKRMCASLWCLISWHPKPNCSYVSSADLPSDSLRKNLAWWAVTWRTSKKHITVKIGRWALAQVWVLARDNTVLIKFYLPWSSWKLHHMHVVQLYHSSTSHSLAQVQAFTVSEVEMNPIIQLIYSSFRENALGYRSLCIGDACSCMVRWGTRQLMEMQLSSCFFLQCKYCPQKICCWNNINVWHSIDKAWSSW